MEIVKRHWFVIPKDDTYTVWNVPDNLYEDVLKLLPEKSIEFLVKFAFEGNNYLGHDVFVKVSESHYQGIQGIIEDSLIEAGLRIFYSFND